MLRLLFTLPILRMPYVVSDITVSQPRGVMSVRLGETVTLECYSKSDKAKRWMWLRQRPGQAPETIITTYYEQQDLYGDLKGSGRITLEKDTRTMNVTMSRVEKSDTAMYFCALSDYEHFHFGTGTFVTVVGSEWRRTVVQQVVSDPVRPGDSVTLQCTVDSETCAGEHSVYWFRHGSGESLPGLIYTHGNRSDECEKNPEAGSPTHGCVYSLPKRNLSRSDAGIYYCAVATCGNILFGNGTKLEVTDSGGVSPVVIALGTLNVCFLTVVIVQICKRRKPFSDDSQRGSENARTESCSNQTSEAEPLNYAALNFTRSKQKPGARRKEEHLSSTYSEVIMSCKS